MVRKKVNKSTKKVINDNTIGSGKKKFYKTKKFRILFVLVFILIFLVIGMNINTTNDKVYSSYLVSYSGDVNVIRNNTKLDNINSVELLLDDVIETKSNSSAVVKLYDKVIVDIDDNSKVKISSLDRNNLEITQVFGKTWNKFKGVLDQDSYEVVTPNSVASVRGTDFKVIVFNDTDNVFVIEGAVNMLLNGVNQTNKEILINKYEKGEAILKNKTLRKIAPSKEDFEEIMNKKENVIKNLKKRRLQIINDNTMLLKLAEKTYGITKKDILENLEKSDKGQIDSSGMLDKAIEKTPYKKDELKRVKELNNVIRNEIVEFEES